MRTSVLTLFGVWVAVSITAAHEFWVYPKQFFAKVGEALPLSIYVGEDYKGERWGGGNRRVQRLRWVTSKGEKDLTGTVDQTDSLVQLKPITVSESGTHVLALETNSSFIELEPDKFSAYLKEDGLDNAMAYRLKNGETKKNGRELYRRCAKTLVQAGNVKSNQCLKSSGMAIEILPLQNPYDLPKGSALTCRFLYENKPLKNALVRCWRRVNDKTALEIKRSDNEGKATFELTKKGNAAYMISVVTMIRLKDTTKADWQSTWGSMTFGMK
ncbi:MAG: DUF4198 domain-containing protein [Spirosomataceae bacterium]